MKLRIATALFTLVLLFGYYCRNNHPPAIHAYNHTNLVPYQAAAVPCLEPKV